jgi:hypothetical protein
MADAEGPKSYILDAPSLDLKLQNWKLILGMPVDLSCGRAWVLIEGKNVDVRPRWHGCKSRS